MDSTKHSLAERFFSITRGLLYTEIFFLPFFFLPFTLDVLELNKQTLLLVLTFAAALCWIAGMMVSKRFAVRRGWINILPIVFFIAISISAWYSSVPFLSWVGGESQEYTSVLTIVALVVLFFLAANTMKEKYSHHLLAFLIILSACLTGIVALLSLFGINLPFSFAHAQVFSPLGTMNTTGIFLVAISGLATAKFVSSHKRNLPQDVCGFLLALLTFIFLLVVDYSVLWILLVASQSIILVFAFVRIHDFKTPFRFILPISLLIISLPFWLLLSSPFSVSLPVEINPSARASREISEQTLSAFSQVFGSGPATYALDFASFHGPQINQTDFFNTRFDRASSYFLTLLPTIGYFGVVTFLLFLFAIGTKTVFHLLQSKPQEGWLEIFSLFVPWTVLVIAGAMYPFNLTLVAFLFLFSGLLGAHIFSTPTIPTKAHTAAFRLLASLFLLIGSLAFLIGIFFTVQRYIGEMAFAKAVRADRSSASLQDIVVSLDKAATLNRFDDRFYRVLADALLLRLKEEIPHPSLTTEVTSETKQYLQGLAAASVNAAVHATELSPRNAKNWLVACSVYRELLRMVPDAQTFAREACLKATELEPFNPSVWKELGVTELAIAGQKRALTVSTDQTIAQTAKTEWQSALSLAEAAFNKAVELKANYAPAHYQLGLVYDQQGRLDDAIGKIESVARYNTSDVGVAFQIGQLYLRRAGEGDLDRAKNALEHAVLLSPSFSNARWFLASVYEQQGDIASAITHIQKVLELNPESPVVKSRLDRLTKGKTEISLPAPIEE